MTRFDELVKYNAFTVERHALQIRQPLEEVDANTYQVACAMVRSQTHRWGRIDFSRGYPEWWYLSHIDFHVPSEHTQEGKRYDAELQMYHFYSVASSVSGFDNEMATVSIFLEVFENATDYYMLNKLICQWRRAAEETRNLRGLPSVETPFTGCTPYNRTASNNETRSRDLFADAEKRKSPTMAQPAHELLINNTAARAPMPHSSPRRYGSTMTTWRTPTLCRMGVI